MITIYEYPLQMIVPEERHQNGYDNLGQDKHIVYIMSQQSVHPVHTRQPLGQGQTCPMYSIKYYLPRQKDTSVQHASFCSRPHEIPTRN